MKKKLLLVFFFTISLLLFILSPSTNEKNDKVIEDNYDALKLKHASFLKNSPFKKTLQLSKKERKKLGIPPNKYYEREWELTMNPATGNPEPSKVLELQSIRNKKNKSISSRPPGDLINNSWEERGPNNVGGRTRVVLFDPNDINNEIVYAGGVSGGLWKNNNITDPNSSWSQVSGVPGNMNISCITVDPNNSNIWYIGTGEQYTFGAAVGNGVYVTTDGGLNWKHVPIQLSGGGTSGNNFAGIYYINNIIAWNNNNNTEVYIGVGTHIYGDASNPINWLGFQNAGLYKGVDSADAGDEVDDASEWSRVQTESLDFSYNGSTYYYIPNDFEISVDNTLWFGCIGTPGTDEDEDSNNGQQKHGRGKVFNTTNGIIWTEITTLPNSNRVELAVSSYDSNKIFALTEGTDGEPHIYSTIDGFNLPITDPSNNTVELPKPNDADTGIPVNDFTRGQDFYNLVIEVDPTNDAIIYVGGIDLFRSNDSGNNWSQISKWSDNNNLADLNCSIVHADQHAFTFRPGNNNEAVIGCDGGVYYASGLSTAHDNDVFTAMNSDYNVTQFYYGGYGQSTTNELIIAGAQDNGSQFINNAIAGTNSSTEVFGGDGAYSTIDKDGDYMIVSYVYNTHAYLSLPYTGNGYLIEDGDSEGDFINQATLDHNLNIMYSNGTNSSYAINRYILGSNSATKNQLTNTLLDASPTAFKVSPYTTNKSYLLVGLENGKLLKLTNANETNSSIVCWEEITGSSFLGSISDIEFGETENDIFVTFHNYGVSNIWVSSNGGTSWIEKEGDLPNMPVKCILQNPLAKNEVIVGTELGIWATKNFNETSPTWVSSFNGMQDVKVVDLDLRTSDNHILATTHGRGVFTGKFDATTDDTFLISPQNSIVNTCTTASSVFYNFQYTPLGNYASSTSISASGVPAGASYTLSSNTFSGSSGSFDLTINDISSVVKGEYVITVTGVGGSTVSKDLLLIVKDDVTNITTISPADGAIQQNINNTNLVWNADSEATLYDVEISTDAGFNVITESETTCNTSYNISSTLDLNTVYYWRVRAKNDCNISSFSEAKKFITDPLNICNDFSSQGASNNIFIPSNATINSTILIPDASNIIISDINVSIDIDHTWVQDLDITLTSPNGTSIVLFQNECTDENKIDITYDDEVNSSISCGTSPISGTFKPTNFLAGFYGEESKGTWTLIVHDDYNGDQGELLNWSLEICEIGTSINSSFTNNLLTVGSSTTYTINQTETEASSLGSTPDEQVFMLAKLPTLGNLTLNSTNLNLGDTFTQNDINTNIVNYVNSSPINSSDSFLVDITNVTNGFLPNQTVNITIDATSLSVNDQFFETTGTSVFPTVSKGTFYISTTSNLDNSQIELFNIAGQKVFQNNVYLKSGEIEKIETNGLASGIYILKISSEYAQGSKKLIIK